MMRLEHLDEPSFARPTLSLSTKAKVRKRDFSTDALDEDTERQAPSLEARGVIDKSSISEVPLFKECSPKFVEAIAEQVSHRLFTPGQEIMTEGDNGDRSSTADGRGNRQRESLDGFVFGVLDICGGAHRLPARLHLERRRRLRGDCRAV
eukprot:g15524.t1